MTRISCRYTGDLHCTAEHDPSRVALHTDAPPDHDGRGESFSPTDLLATALGTCVLTVMGIMAKHRNWTVTDAKASVEKIMSQTGPRKIETLRVWITLPPGLTEDQVQLFKRVVNDCPVKRNLEPSMTIDLIWC
jgi:putative redox protein